MEKIIYRNVIETDVKEGNLYYQVYKYGIKYDDYICVQSNYELDSEYGFVDFKYIFYTVGKPTEKELEEHLQYFRVEINRRMQLFRKLTDVVNIKNLTKKYVCSKCKDGILLDEEHFISQKDKTNRYCSCCGNEMLTYSDKYGAYIYECYEEYIEDGADLEYFDKISGEE